MACAVIRDMDISRTGHPVLDETWRHATAVAGLSATWTAFADLAATTGPRGWDAPTRCERWAVRDVAAHVTGHAIDIARGRVPPGPPAEQAAAHRARTPRDMARALTDAAPPVLDLLRSAGDAWDDPRRRVRERTVAESAVALWHDTLVHLDDIRDALGRPPVPAHDLLPCVAHLAHTLRRRPVPFAVDLPRLGIVRSDDDVPPKACSVHDFVLVATGRQDPSTIGAPPTIDVYASRPLLA